MEIVAPPRRYNRAHLCGLSFVLDPAGERVARRVRAMHATIRHRGPDGEAFAFVARDGSIGDAEGEAIAGLAFRRLTILDLTDAAMQPMLSADRRTAILFNGEIYNFRELRSELESRGRVFRTTGDTEVVLAAFEAWGEECFARFEGMWAIIVVDAARRRVVASRDRFGIKPLHWTIADGALLLASEARQILAAVEGRPRANAFRVAQHLRGLRYPATDETFFEGINTVPPATWFAMPFEAVEQPKFREYWRLRDFTATPHDYPAALHEFEALLADAVRTHHVADVAIGSFLSGGLDSSMITTLLADVGREEQRKFPSFSFGFRAAHKEISELPYVDAIVAQQSLVNHETGFDAAWVAANVQHVVESIEEPPLALPVLAQYRTFQLAHEHGIKVILDGQGADEILGGYPYHQRIRLGELLRRGRAAAFARELHAIGVKTALDFVVPPILRRLRRNRPLVAPDYGRSARDEVRRDTSSDPSAVNRRAYFDVRWGNVKIILDYADRNAMAHSIEARVPFFDRRLVEFAFSLPPEFKVANGERKRILRDAARKRLPAKITERADRMGFGTPDAAFINGPLRATMLDRITASGVDRLPFVQSPRPEDPRALWRLYTLALWQDAFRVTL